MHVKPRRARRSFASVSPEPGHQLGNYDTIYTERYLGLPEQNPEGYTPGNVRHSLLKIPSSGMSRALAKKTGAKRDI